MTDDQYLTLTASLEYIREDMTRHEHNANVRHGAVMGILQPEAIVQEESDDTQLRRILRDVSTLQDNMRVLAAMVQRLEGKVSRIEDTLDRLDLRLAALEDVP